MSRTFWLVSDTGKHIVRPPVAIRQQFRTQAIQVEMFSVGKGESILISRGLDFVMVDGGSVPGKRKNDELAGLLAARVPPAGIRAVIASHPHQDHVNAHRQFGDVFSDRLAANAEYFDNAIQRSTDWFKSRVAVVPNLPLTRRPIGDDPSKDPQSRPPKRPSLRPIRTRLAAIDISAVYG